MVHRRRRATLFPYTTLFRSAASSSSSSSFTPATLTPSPIGAAVRDHFVASGLVQRLFTYLLQAGSSGYAAKGDGDTRDRKSTRLNSSHSSISYAAFCLKKQT